MYCNCLSPKIVTNTACGETFEVCAESKGGCGNEVKAGPPPIPKKDTPIYFDSELIFTTCTVCKGAGRVSTQHINGPILTKECEDCFGIGVI
jgi:hypothetical protein